MPRDAQCDRFRSRLPEGLLERRTQFVRTAIRNRYALALAILAQLDGDEVDKLSGYGNDLAGGVAARTELVEKGASKNFCSPLVRTHAVAPPWAELKTRLTNTMVMPLSRV